jgi:hypothetical protein
MLPRQFICATTAGSDRWVANDGSPWRRAKMRLATLAEFATVDGSLLEESR